MLQENKDAARLMGKVIQQVTEAITLHFIAVLQTSFGIIAPVVNVSLGPATLEGWYKRPRWRFELMVGRYRGVRISGEQGDYLFAYGNWTKTKSRIGDDPEVLKLKLFGLRPASIVYTSMAETLLDEHPVWIIEGVSGTGERARWWIGKDDLLVKQVEIGEISFEFHHAGQRKHGKLPVKTGLRFNTLELGSDISNQLFEIPPNAHVVEELSDDGDVWNRWWQVLE